MMKIMNGATYATLDLTVEQWESHRKELETQGWLDPSEPVKAAPAKAKVKVKVKAGNGDDSANAD